MNEKLDQQIEFDEYIFYIECRDQFDDEDLKNHIASCIGKDYADMINEEIVFYSTLFPLCKYNDIKTYKRLLELYVKFLDELLPKLMEISISKMELKHEDLAFGFFVLKFIVNRVSYLQRANFRFKKR